MNMTMTAKFRILAASAVLVLAGSASFAVLGLSRASGGEPENAPAAEAAGKPKAYPYRWFYTSVDFSKDAALADLKKAIDAAAASGLNGLVLTSGYAHIAKWPKEDLERLLGLKTYCDERKVDLIPCLFTPGSGWSELRHDRNLAEGMPVRDILFQVKGNEANVVPETPLSIADGDFENADGDNAKGLSSMTSPGRKNFIDRDAARQGKASLRIESEPGRWIDVSVKTPKPYKHYVARLWAKASVPKPAGTVFVSIQTEKGEISRGIFSLKDGNEWQKIEWSFCTLDFKEVAAVVGAAGKKGGPTGEKFWIDCLEVFEPGLVNVLRRPGAPLIVRKEGENDALKEGADFETVACKWLDFSKACPAPTPIRIIPGGRIKDGDRLLVSYYTWPCERWGNTVLCMSEPKVYDIWQDAARRVHEAIKPKKWFLNADEVRGGGTCMACRERKNPDGTTMIPAQILGDCVTRQAKIIRDICPDAEMAVWNDMFDPNHNSTSFYFTVPGGYLGSWEYIPKDLIVSCWYGERAEKSLAHFSSLGFRTMAAAYYDTGNLDGSRKWLECLDKTPKAVGIMYTTWEHDFKLLAPFGDLVNRK